MAIIGEQIISVMRSATEPLDWVNAMWLGGSAAFGNDDELSDVDVQMDVADGRQEEVFAIVESALADNLAPIEVKWRVPEPAWHGHHQAVYRLEGSPEHLLIDFVVMQRSTKAPRLDEREIHGEPVIVFDKLASSNQSRLTGKHITKKSARASGKSACATTC